MDADIPDPKITLCGLNLGWVIHQQGKVIETPKILLEKILFEWIY